MATIALEEGDKVKFNGVTDPMQIQWGGHTDPKSVGMIEGHIYTVSDVEQHSWHTRIYLKEFDLGAGVYFNSVWFEYEGYSPWSIHPQ